MKTPGLFQRKAQFSILLFLALILPNIFTSVSAQDPCAELNYHAFKAESFLGTYTDLGTEGTQIFTDDHDDGNSLTLQEIGFPFVYHCQAFTQFTFNTNGFIKLGSETTPKDNLFFSNAQSVDGGVFNNADSNNVNLIVVFNHDIERGVDDYEFRVHTAGAAPYRVCTIQWENMREWTYDPPKQYMNMDFQIRLYETSNVIEFVYGEWEPTDTTSNYKTAACGLKGASTDEDQLLVVVKSSSAEWSNVTFHNGNYAPNESFNFGNPPDRPKPVAGQTYRFTPTYLNDLTAQQSYTMGQASRYFSSPQKISAHIRNTGYNTQTDIPVILDISGANTYRDTQYIPGLAFDENVRITFPGYKPSANGVSEIRIFTPDDDYVADNGLFDIQVTSDTELNYSAEGGPTGTIGFPSGAQGVYYNRYLLFSSAYVDTVRAFIANNTASTGKTIFAVILDEQQQVVARSEDYFIQPADLGGWHSFSFASPPFVDRGSFFAGLGMMASLEEYAPLGVQKESPIRPETYFRSNINGTGFTALDTLTFTHRFMIGVTLTGPEPVAGMVNDGTTICSGSSTTLKLEGAAGFIQWQTSPDGIAGWKYVTEGTGNETTEYTTPVLSQSAYFRAEVFQPGHDVVYSNTAFVDVTPETPMITNSGDVLISSAVSGNQWYDDNGPVPGATGQSYLATSPGSYYVIVTKENCTSAPSNIIELLTVSMDDPDLHSRFSIYPNPFDEEIIIEKKDQSVAGTYSILNAFGQLIQTGILQDKKIIRTSDFGPGMYVILVEMGGKMGYMKMIKW